MFGLRSMSFFSLLSTFWKISTFLLVQHCIYNTNGKTLASEIDKKKNNNRNGDTELRENWYACW